MGSLDLAATHWTGMSYGERIEVLRILRGASSLHWPNVAENKSYAVLARMRFGDLPIAVRALLQNRAAGSGFE